MKTSNIGAQQDATAFPVFLPQLQDATMHAPMTCIIPSYNTQAA